MIAPEPYRSAYLSVVRDAITLSRLLARRSQCSFWLRFFGRHSEQVADLQDAIHVVVELINEWERCDEKSLREIYLAAYDKKWTGKGEFGYFSMISRFNEVFEKFNASPSIER